MIQLRKWSLSVTSSAILLLVVIFFLPSTSNAQLYLFTYTGKQIATKTADSYIQIRLIVDG